jgi:polyferredoxin
VIRSIPIKPWSVQEAPGTAGARQRQRLWWQAGFFVLFVVAPVFDILRFDLDAGHAIILGLDWRLGLDDFFAGRIGATEAGLNILLRLFLPLVAGAIALMAIAWRWGRLYCGWLCPHFSVVETINHLMRHASGRPSVWERKPLPERNPDGSSFPVDARWWLVTVPLAVGFAFVWAVVLITYLLPPMEVYANLLSLELTRNQFIFIAAATVVLSIEFLFARHLFCRYGCAVGLFQSLAWMSNRGAMVIGFERTRAAECGTCYRADGVGAAACEVVCPMRLKPRSTKNAMFTCTQCGQCLAACNTVQGEDAALLRWIDKEAARQNEALVSLTGKRD